MKKHILSIALCLCMVLGLMPMTVLAESGNVWNGAVDTAWYNVEDKSFSINTEAELAGFAQIVNGTASGISQDSFAGKTITLTADLDLNLCHWIPVGTLSAPFQGKFDGGHHSINNLLVKDMDANNHGFFGCIQDAVICDVTLSGVSVEGNTNIGGIAGKAVNSTITGCTVENSYKEGNDDSWSVYGRESVGGIVGCSQNSRIRSCINKSNVFLLTSGDDPARHKLGGIAGVATLSVDKCSEEDAVLIADCINTGKITCTTEENFQCTGGIVGRLVSDNADYRAIVKDCKNTGPVSSIEAGTGGIVGYAQNASIEDCENQNDITGTTGVGGIAGYAYYGTQILNCTNSGSVTGNLYNSADPDDPDAVIVYPYNIGGIVGSIYNPRDTEHLEGDCDSLPTYSYNRDSVISKCINNGDVTCNFIWPEVTAEIRYENGVACAVNVFGAFVGGIAGFAVDSAYFDEEGNVIRIEDCTNYGTVTGNTYTGGVLGIGKNAIVTDCTNNGFVTNAEDDSDSDNVRTYIGSNSYTVRFDANGGAMESEDMLNMALFGVLDALPTPTRDDYTFDGWFTDAVGGTEITTETVFSGRTTVYAHWTYCDSSGGEASNPDTGSNSPTALWIALLFVSGAGVIGATVCGKKKRAK